MGRMDGDGDVNVVSGNRMSEDTEWLQRECERLRNDHANLELECERLERETESLASANMRLQGDRDKLKAENERLDLELTGLNALYKNRIRACDELGIENERLKAKNGKHEAETPKGAAGLHDENERLRSERDEMMVNYDEAIAAIRHLIKLL